MDSSPPEEIKGEEEEEDDNDSVLEVIEPEHFVAVEKQGDRIFLLKHESDPAKNTLVEVHLIDEDIIEFRGLPLDLQVDIEA